MKKFLFILCLCITNLGAETLNLNENVAHSMIEQRMKFFKEVFLVQYEKNKLSLDFDKKSYFIDLCKYPTGGYQFPCGNINGEEVGIRKYFIEAKNIEEAYYLFKAQYELSTMPKINLYDYGKIKSNKEDEVGTYYIWDRQGRFWVINMGYDSGSITIYTQTKDYIEVIYQWSVDW